MRIILFDFNCIIQNRVHPTLAHIQLGNRVVPDNLQNQVVAPIEDSLKQLVLLFKAFVKFVADSHAHQIQDFEDYLADLEVF